MLNLVTYLNWIHVFEWNVVWCGSKNIFLGTIYIYNAFYHVAM